MPFSTDRSAAAAPVQSKQQSTRRGLRDVLTADISSRSGEEPWNALSKLMMTASVDAECLSEAGAYYGSDFPAAVHVANASSAEACCRICQSTPDCSVWNWYGSSTCPPLPDS